MPAAFPDLRSFLDKLDREGELCHVGTEVDWHLELGAISRRALDIRAPALLFEAIKGYAPDRGRVLANIFGRSKAAHGRFALALGLPSDIPIVDLIAEFAQLSTLRIPPRVVKTGSCKENIMRGPDVDLLHFPVPTIHGGDGGRYIGTWHVNVTKDPDTGLVNWGMYRHLVHDANHLGWWVAPAQHAAATFYQKYEPRGERMPIAIVIGTEPMSSIMAGCPVPAGVSEADVVGGMRGAPVELVACETIDLEVPAHAEIVIEGEVVPGARIDEGPFGEFTGYMAADRAPRPVIEVKCITHRNNPILTISNIGKPWDEESVLGSAGWSALLGQALRAQGHRFKEVYVPPPLQAVVMSVNPPYPGYLQTLASAIWSSKLGIYRPYIFFVGEDVDVTDMDDVFWCMTTRLHPSNGIHIQKDTPALALWPWLLPDERRLRRAPRVYFDATFPPEWGDAAPRVIDFAQGWPKDVQQLVLDRWSDYGISGLTK
jgi:4-hydroxy-3-polyprenylbenzoate decarboxylase